MSTGIQAFIKGSQQSATILAGQCSSQLGLERTLQLLL